LENNRLFLLFMELAHQCIQVLDKNWKGRFTIPSPRLYPFQWNWDSGFIALGNLHHKPERALTEMEALFSGQWKNGFLPHIIFHNAEKYSSYFPSADYWNSGVSEEAPADLKTSGITQPPVHGFILEELFKAGLDIQRISELFDKVSAYHRWLYQYREHESTGLVAIWHNWESGMDNSPWWDIPLERITLDELEYIQLERKDVHEVKESESTRPKDLDYKRYLYLVDTLREHKYSGIPDDFPFQILDPVFNSILLASTESLIRLGKVLNKKTDWLSQKLNQGTESFDVYFLDDEQDLYFPYDLVGREQQKRPCSGSYIPIFAGIPSLARVQRMLKPYREQTQIRPFPSCHPEGVGFEQKNYWRGPVWVNMNWLIWKGLLNYHLSDEAELVKNQTIEMVKEYGIFEYFNPFTDNQSGTGYGGADFSWTAALVLDMINKTTS